MRNVTLLTEPQERRVRARLRHRGASALAWAPEGLGPLPAYLGAHGYLGAAEDVPVAEAPFDVRAAFEAHGQRLAALQETAEKDLFFRKIATGAAIAGALFAAVRLTDIWLAVKRQRRSSSES